MIFFNKKLYIYNTIDHYCSVQNDNFFLNYCSGNEKELNLIKHFIKEEDQMNEEILSRKSQVTITDFEEEVYKVDTTGATISSASSVSLLHHYCSKLPHDEYARFTNSVHINFSTLQSRNFYFFFLNFILFYFTFLVFALSLGSYTNCFSLLDISNPSQSSFTSMMQMEWFARLFSHAMLQFIKLSVHHELHLKRLKETPV